MCAALAYLLVENVEDGWLCIMPLKIWNVHGQRHRTNNAVEGSNAKLNRSIGIKKKRMCN